MVSDWPTCRFGVPARGSARVPGPALSTSAGRLWFHRTAPTQAAYPRARKVSSRSMVVLITFCSTQIPSSPDSRRASRHSCALAGHSWADRILLCPRLLRVRQSSRPKCNRISKESDIVRAVIRIPGHADVSPAITLGNRASAKGLHEFPDSLHNMRPVVLLTHSYVPTQVDQRSTCRYELNETLVVFDLDFVPFEN